MAGNAGLTYQELQKAFRQRTFKPLYFLYGDETFLMDELQDLLVQHALEEHERDFNYDLVYGADSDAPAVLSICQAFPMMAARRVVVVRNFMALKRNVLFKHYAAKPNPAAVVLLLCRRKPNLRVHPYRALKQHATWGEFKPFYERQMPQWIAGRIKEQGCHIEPRAAAMLADFVGTSLRAAASEIDKLITYVGDRGRLTAEDVIRASGQTRECNVFELQRAIVDGRGADAQHIGQRMLGAASNKTGELLRIIAFLRSYFARLWKLQGCQRQQLSRTEMASVIGVQPYRLKEYLRALRCFPGKTLEEAFSALLAADCEIKGGSHRSAALVLTLLLRRLDATR